MAPPAQVEAAGPREAGADSLGIRVYLAMAAGLVAGAAWRPTWNNPDYWQYREWYLEGLSVAAYLRAPLTLLERDPGYFLVATLARHLGLPFATFALLFTSAWMAVKAVQIYRLSNAPLLSLLLYACFFYPLHDLIQMRAAAAVALFLLALPLLVEGRRLAYVGVVLVAASFHLSALALVPLALLRRDGVRPRWYLAALVASAAFAASGIRLDFLVHWVADLALEPRFAFYAAQLATDLPTGTAFNRVSVPELALAVLLLLKFDEVRAITPYASYVVRIFAIAQILFFLFVTGAPIFGFRLVQLMGSVVVLAWALFWGVVRDERLKLATVAIVAVLYLSVSARLFP